MLLFHDFGNSNELVTAGHSWSQLVTFWSHLVTFGHSCVVSEVLAWENLERHFLGDSAKTDVVTLCTVH